MIPFLTKPANAKQVPDLYDSEPWVRLGMRVVVYMCGGILAFSALFTISGAVVTPGSVNVEGNYQTVQHQEGGIVQKIHVKNGDKVKAGDLLVKLDDTQARAALDLTRARAREFLIQRARLEAERDRKESFTLPEGVDPADPDVVRVVKTQEELFQARRTARTGARSVLIQRAEQLKSEAKSLESQEAAARKQAEINSKELANVLPLFEKGFVNTQRVAPLQREAARLEGELGRVGAERGKNRSALAETELRVTQADNEYMQEVADELRKAQAGLAEQDETLKAHTDRVERTSVRAPRDGFVHARAVHTEGGVVTPGGTLLQIIPDQSKLVVDGQLNPQDIDKVRAGQKSFVMFPAFNARQTPRLEGNVVKVSPAEITDQQGRRYFTVQVAVTPDELKKLPEGHSLMPGMPAELFIETTPRTILSYFLKPLTDALMRSLREG